MPVFIKQHGWSFRAEDILVEGVESGLAGLHACRQLFAISRN